MKIGCILVKKPLFSNNFQNDVIFQEIQKCGENESCEKKETFATHAYP